MKRAIPGAVRALKPTDSGASPRRRAASIRWTSDSRVSGSTACHRPTPSRWAAALLPERKRTCTPSVDRAGLQSHLLLGVAQPEAAADAATERRLQAAVTGLDARRPRGPGERLQVRPHLGEGARQHRLLQDRAHRRVAQGLAAGGTPGEGGPQNQQQQALPPRARRPHRVTPRIRSCPSASTVTVRSRASRISGSSRGTNQATRRSMTSSAPAGTSSSASS